MLTVKTEIASEVECILCGTKKFSTVEPYICFLCWKNGEAARYIVFLQARGTTQPIQDAAERCEECGFPPYHHDPSSYVHRKPPRSQVFKG